MPSGTVGWGQILEAADHAATVLGVVIGGGWVYFNAFRGRLFTPRLAVKVSAVLATGRLRRFILVSCQIQNTGLRTATINRESTVVTVTSLGLQGDARFIRSGREEEQRSFGIAQGHAYLEPGSIVQDAVAVFLPPRFAEAFRIELVVSAHGQRWTADAIVLDEAAAVPGKPRNVTKEVAYE